jgi:Spy/CpxP family protein refolding chaperone
MSTETSSPAPQPAPAAPKRRRLRGFLYASALLIGGGLIGALVASPSTVLGWHDHYGWERGGDSGDWGPRRWRDRDDGHRGWHRGDDRGPRHHGFSPGRIERMLDRVLDRVDASTEQRQKITRIVERAADDVLAFRDKHLEGRKQLREVLAAQTIDRGKLEALRTEQLQLADGASKRITDALAEAAEVLNPSQREELSRTIDRWQRWRRG